MRTTALLLITLASALLTGCASSPATATRNERLGDEIVVAGQMFHTGTPIVLWFDPGGYDGYRAAQRFTPFSRSRREREGEPPVAQRYNYRSDTLTDDELDRVTNHGWDLQTLQKHVDQFVIHYDVCGDSKTCFRVLHDMRGLSIHFMLDLDGTIYQTLDLKERAWHATISNSRSIGIEIANMGAYPEEENEVFDRWYQRDGDETVITIPEARGDGGIRDQTVALSPARSEPVAGRIHDRDLFQYDLTPQQYEALIKLTATLCTVFPEIQPDYPRDEAGNLIPGVLTEEQHAAFGGLIGHYHIQRNKIDPGPAFDWDRVVNGARKLIRDHPEGHWTNAPEQTWRLPVER